MLRCFVVSFLIVFFMTGGAVHSADADPASTPNGTSRPAQHAGGTLKLTAQSAPGSADPQVNYLAPMLQVEAVVYDGLMTFAKAPGPLRRHAVPDLADGQPEQLDDGRTWRFHLRKNIYFSTGQLLTTDDVVASMRRIFKVNSPTAGPYFSHIIGGSLCLHQPKHCTLDGGVVADKETGTIVFHLTHSDPEFPDRLAFGHAVILPENTSVNDTGNNAPPGTGPYRITSYNPNSEMRLERNTWFRQWDALAQPAGYPDHIIYRFGFEPESEVTAIENGQFDWMAENVPLDRLSELGQHFTSRVRLVDFLNLYYAALNVNTPPFDNLKARQAFNYAVSRRAMVIHNGGPAVAIPACQMIPQGAPGFEPACMWTKGASPSDPAPEWEKPDMEQARKLITESGTAGQKVIIVSPQTPGYLAMANELRSTLARLGYIASVRSMVQAVQFPYVQNSDNRVQVALTGWNADYPAASSYLETLLSCKTFHPHSDNSLNMSGYCDQGADLLMAQARAVAVKDQEAGDHLWAAADRELMAGAPTVPLAQVRWVTLLSSRVQGEVTAPIYQIIFSRFQIQ
ncbi:MAG: ABC transporter substrate-binding protein [Acetobacter sp.]|jgi:peptide/nickel transport system substrate-binding protein|nr:ABC transporter substrate-binding protein [Acetobacter sp.]MCH4061088.1 ABC transporter substrate-binding protein [Acetobacter sp.]MCH4088027.1 ABC transporter substrate-binding protein [Acetobacter sp.]MCI1293359.1 ABC transporter substrate-binding protein [Acetobacter sp.]MCI1320016.1 ABC transporter substrate-binding protein [Acetobacter sp.]